MLRADFVLETADMNRERVVVHEFSALIPQSFQQHVARDHRAPLDERNENLVFSQRHTSTEVKTRKLNSDATDIIVTDSVGNTILKVDDDGIKTTEVSAPVITDESSDFIVADEEGNTILQVNKDGVKTTEVSASRLQDETDDFVIVDSEGNTVLQVDDNGLKTTNVGTERLLNGSDNLTISDAEGNAVFKVDCEGSATTKINVEELRIHNKPFSFEHIHNSPLHTKNNVIAEGNYSFSKTINDGDLLAVAGFIYSGLYTDDSLLSADTTKIKFQEGAEYSLELDGIVGTAKLRKYDFGLNKFFGIYNAVCGWLIEFTKDAFEETPSIFSTALPNGKYIESLYFAIPASDGVGQGYDVTNALLILAVKCDIDGLSSSLDQPLTVSFKLFQDNYLYIDASKSNIATTDYVLNMPIYGDGHTHSLSTIAASSSVSSYPITLDDLLKPTFETPDELTGKVTFVGPSATEHRAFNISYAYLDDHVKAVGWLPTTTMLRIDPDSRVDVNMCGITFSCTCKRAEIAHRYDEEGVFTPNPFKDYVMRLTEETDSLFLDIYPEGIAIYILDTAKIANEANQYNNLVSFGLTGVDVTISLDPGVLVKNGGTLINSSAIKMPFNKLADSPFKYSESVVYDDTVLVDKYNISAKPETGLAGKNAPKFYGTIQVKRDLFNLAGLAEEIGVSMPFAPSTHVPIHNADINGYPFVFNWDAPSFFSDGDPYKNASTSAELEGVSKYNSAGELAPLFDFQLSNGSTPTAIKFYVSEEELNSSDEFITVVVGFDINTDGLDAESIPPSVEFDLKLYSYNNKSLYLEESNSGNVATKEFVKQELDKNKE